MVLFFYFFGLTGYRFTPLSAAKGNPFISSDYELIDEFHGETAFLYLFKSEEEEMYRTVLSEREGIFYRSPVSISIPMTYNQIRTIGAMSSANDNGESFSLLVIESFDEDVAYIEAGRELKRERQEVKKGESVTFLFPYSKQIDHLNAIAFNEDGEKLYYYGYPNNQIFPNYKDLKWYPYTGE
ncbi:MAG: hypothetical protein LRY73_11560 [Bacillus sp. (in: Bacteria)]|nr:hypothetical protein [Bacillus sp. (in: firmicutes)]